MTVSRPLKTSKIRAYTTKIEEIKPPFVKQNKKLNQNTQTKKIQMIWTWDLYEEGRTLELIDPDIESTCSKEEVLRVIEVSLLCTQAVPTMRPSMSRVVAMLTGKVQVIPSTSHPRYIKDWQYNIAIAGATGTGSTPVIATTPMHNSKESSAERECDSIED